MSRRGRPARAVQTTKLPSTRLACFQLLSYLCWTARVGKPRLPSTMVRVSPCQSVLSYTHFKRCKVDIAKAGQIVVRAARLLVGTPPVALLSARCGGCPAFSLSGRSPPRFLLRVAGRVPQLPDSSLILSPDRGVGYRSRGCGRNDQTPGNLPRSKSPIGAQDGLAPRIPTPLRGFIRGALFPGVWLHIATLVRPHPRLRHLPPLSGLSGTPLRGFVVRVAGRVPQLSLQTRSYLQTQHSGLQSNLAFPPPYLLNSYYPKRQSTRECPA